ncbi:unnamed protein product [Mytilus coruscus]|uniref:Death domain-containing protein n=1 Tax=Mytilus coruscus TaxID=42192 RepID=A0A6J8D9A1_MYTCO|nr:unnamed protein product [Mytilus coruscus]
MFYFNCEVWTGKESNIRMYISQVNLTALHYASANGHREIVSILLDNGFDLNALTPDGVSVLHCAVENGQKEIVSELLHNDCDLHRVTDYGRTVLHWAADNGHIEIVPVLLDKELDLLNHVDKDGWLALHLAAQNGIMDIVSELLRRGSDSNAATSDGNTALHLSSSTGHKEVVTVLLDHAADPNAKNEEGNTVLHLSARNRHKDVVLILLDNAADPNAVDADGNTPLILSAVIGHKEIVSILLDKDADPNAKNVDLLISKRDIVSILVERGAKLDSSTADGETALDLVSYRCLPKTRRRSEMKSFLQEEIQKGDLLQQLRGLGLETASDLQDLLLDSSFKSYWNRVYLVGPYSVGKSCLAKVLVGEQVPESRESTDGIWICMGKAGMDVDEMKWIYFEKGLGTMTLEQCPSDKHLRRLVGELSPGKCRELAIELGLKVHEWENFETQFQHQISDDFKFVAVQSCTEKSRDLTFGTLVRVLEKLELTSHLLCKVLRDVKPDVSDILEDTLNSTPSPIVLLDLSNRIGNSTMQLALELDVDASTIQQIQYKHKNKLLEQTKEILLIWSKKQQPKPTLLLLIKALHRIGKMGSLRGITF